MAPVTLPVPISERFLIQGTGALTFTEAQRASRVFSVTIEKVRPTDANGVGQVIPTYLNQKWPEPQGHWGYYQLLQRDWVKGGGPLSYRREVLFSYDATYAEILARLRCYLEKDHDYNTQAYEAILGSLGEAGPGGGVPNIDELKTLWELSLESQLLPTVPETAIWYQLADGWKAQVTLTYSAFATLNCGIEAQQAPPPGVPGVGGSGNGPIRDAPNPPPGRGSDPLSDLASPPSDASAGPALPEAAPPPPQGATRTRYVAVGTINNAPPPDCNSVAVALVLLDKPGIFPASSFSNAQTFSGAPRRCGDVGKTFNIFFNGSPELIGYTENWLTGPSFQVQYL
jgi:hypothetical protein